jgi:CMP-N-acetylneuraminic acid synthetase
MRHEIINAIKRDSTYAIIPARSGSKGIPHKNVRLLGGYPLIAYSIITAKLVTEIDRIIVTTDSKKYADIARKYGAEIPTLRPFDISQDYSTDFQFTEHIINWLYDNEGSVPEYFVQLRPTNPLRKTDLIKKAINTLKANINAFSLCSAHSTNHVPFKWFLKTPDGYFTPLIQGMQIDDTNKPRQTFPLAYIHDGYVDVFRTKNIINCDRLCGDLTIGFESPDSIDIDHEEDFKKLEYLIKESNSIIYQYLKKHFKVEFQ